MHSIYPTKEFEMKKLSKQEQAIKAAVAKYAAGKGAKVSDAAAPKIKHGNVVVALAESHDFGAWCKDVTMLQWRASHPFSLYGYKMIRFAGKDVPQLMGVAIDFLFNEVEVVS